MTTLREKLGREARCYANDSPSGREIRRAFFRGSINESEHGCYSYKYPDFDCIDLYLV